MVGTHHFSKKADNCTSDPLHTRRSDTMAACYHHGGLYRQWHHQLYRQWHHQLYRQWHHRELCGARLCPTRHFDWNPTSCIASIMSAQMLDVQLISVQQMRKLHRNNSPIASSSSTETSWCGSLAAATSSPAPGSGTVLAIGSAASSKAISWLST